MPGASQEMSEHVRRARRTAARARATVGVTGLVLLAGWPALAARPMFAVIGFAIILATAAVQLVVPGIRWLVLEESLAGLAGLAIVGLGDQRVTALSVLWLAAVACGVLARGGRVHWIGRAVLLTSLALPVLRMRALHPEHAALIVAAIWLLLTCGRVTVELSHLLARARHDADHDGLTGALSRTALHRALSRRLAAGEHLGLLVVDLDDFGHINKTSGHAAGDRTLVAAVARLADVAGPAGVVGRLGGDEFAVVVGDEAPAAVAGRVLDALALPAADSGALRASIGMACAPRDGTDADALLRAGDVALRVAKRGGKRRVAAYEGQPLTGNAQSGARGALERLIAGEGVEMVVQPMVDPATGGVHAYEALARFRTRGTSSPLHWFALADEFALRPELELACLRAALALLPGRPAGTRLSVNLSGPCVLDDRVLATLAQHPDLGGLIVEITEDALVRDDSGLLPVLDTLVSRGARIAIDDMGAGYSGLRQVTMLRPAYLKLDRSLVAGIDGSPDRAALVEAVVHYARRTGGHVVAEGVEHLAELETVRALGVAFVQGFYYGRPASGWPLPSISRRVGAGER